VHSCKLGVIFWPRGAGGGEAEWARTGGRAGAAAGGPGAGARNACNVCQVSLSLLLLGVGLWHNNNLTCAQPTEVVQEIIIYFVNTIVVGRLMVLLCSHGLDFGLLTTFFPHSNQVSKVSFWA
jgi:hypothetical protein